MYRHLIVFVCLTIAGIHHAFQGPFRRMYSCGRTTQVNASDDPGEPLFLTSYLEQGKIDQAKQLRFLSIDR
jgi:hypothetical protein